MQLSDVDRLQAQLIDLMLSEGRLQDQGMTCSIKDRKDSCCSACPLYGRERTRALCQVGREQERTTMSLLAHE